MKVSEIRLAGVLVYINSLLVCLTSAAPAFSRPRDTLTLTLNNQSEKVAPRSIELPSSSVEQSLVKRQCVLFNSANGEDVFICDENMPLVSEMVTRMRQGALFGTSTVRRGALPGNPVFFYTSLPGTRQEQVGWGRIWVSGFIGESGTALGLSSYDALNAVSRNWFVAQSEFLLFHLSLWFPGDLGFTKTSTAWSNCYCEALAAAAQATYAILGIPNGETWRPDSTWATVEYGALTQNPNIQTIYAVDPRPNCEVEAPRVLWQRGLNPELPIQSPCVWTTLGFPTSAIATITITSPIPTTTTTTSSAPPTKRTAVPERIANSRM